VCSSIQIKSVQFQSGWTGLVEFGFGFGFGFGIGIGIGLASQHQFVIGNGLASA
jgi:hypothetical protein